MTDDTTVQGVQFKLGFTKPVVVQFDQPSASSDGGALLLKALDERLGVTAALAACVVDRRQPGKVQHSVHDLIRQRVYGIACGYEDCNDVARLGADPVQRMLLDRDPSDGAWLAAQATLSRFENSAGPKTLMRMGLALMDTVIGRQRAQRRGRARLITIDMDPTDDPTHGQQELAFFNGHYGTWCYLPMAACVQFDREPEQHLVGYVLRPGNVNASKGAVGILRRIVARVRDAFPQAKIRVRLDGGFASPGMFEYLEAERLEYVVGMAGNAVLKAKGEALMGVVRVLTQLTGETEHLYADLEYAAGSWGGRQRRVVLKAEVVRLGDREPRDNMRFVVTNVRGTAKWVYEKVYCQRGDMENRIKELHHGLAIDRTSCSRFWANQLRVMLTAAAYVLMQALRAQLTGDDARLQVTAIRLRFLKLAAWVKRSARRIVVHMPDSSPWRRQWCALAGRIGAIPI